MGLKVLKNIFWLLSERGVIIFSALLVSGVLARSLGVEDYGRFQYAISVFNLFLALTYICGAEVVVPSLAGSDSGSGQRVVRDAFFLRFFSAVFAFVLLVVYAVAVEEGDLRWLLIVLGIMLLFKEPTGVVIAWLQAGTNNRPSSLIQMGASIVKLACVFVVFFSGHGGLLSYSFAWVVESLFVALGLRRAHIPSIPIQNGNPLFA